MPAQAQGTLSTLGAKDNNEKRGSRSNLANIGIRVQERKNSRQAIEQQLTDKTILMKDPDGNLVECEIISSRLKETMFQKSVPFLPPIFAGILFFLNICPGLGTFIGALTVVFGAKTTYDNKKKGVLVGVLTAGLQVVTACVLVGWFWSIMHGVHFIQKSKDYKKKVNMPSIKVEDVEEPAP